MMKSLLSILILVAVFLITACDDENNVRATDLAKWDCTYTKQNFMGTESICTMAGGRGSCAKWEERSQRYYVYQCPNKGRVLSKYKLEYTKEQ